MTKYKFLVGTSLLTLSTMASADVAGIYAGANRWNYDIDGDVRSVGNNVSLTNDLGLSDDDSNILYLALEHPIPLLPNIKIQQNKIEGNATGVASQDFNFNNLNIAQGDATITSYDLSHTDFTLYYEILDNWVNLDLGITAKDFDGHILVGINGATVPAATTLNLSGTVPLLYGKAQFDLPFTGLSTGVIAHLGQVSDDKMTDASAYLAYEGDSGFGVEIGYRTFSLEFDEFDGLSSDLTIDGFYAGFSFHF